MVSSLLFVAMILLGVTALVLLITALRKHPTVDIDGWHRRMRAIRDTAQPDAHKPAAGDPFIMDTADRNIRLLAGEEQAAPEMARHAYERAPGREVGKGRGSDEAASSTAEQEGQQNKQNKQNKQKKQSQQNKQRKQNKQSRKSKEGKSRQQPSTARKGSDTTEHSA